MPLWFSPWYWKGLSASGHLVRLAELAKRCAGRKRDLADLCLLGLSELNPDPPVITTDVRDFSVYRQGGVE